MSLVIINHKVREFREGDLAVRETLITFLGLCVFKAVATTTNTNIVAQLGSKKRSKKVHIKGFNLN